MIPPEHITLLSLPPNNRPSGSKSAPRTRHFAGKKAFTLVELLMVIGVIVAMMAVAVPAFNSIKGGSDVTTAVYDISGALDEARTYALANNTYVWVGFFEEDGSQNSANQATPGTGRIVISVVASKDGTSYSNAVVDGSHPAAFGHGDLTNQVSLINVNKLIKIDGMHMAAANNGLTSGNSPSRPPVATAYQVGSSAFQTLTNQGAVQVPTTFTYPISAASTQAQYTFNKIIEFNPQGEASKIVDGVTNGPQAWMEIAIQPTHGNLLSPNYANNLYNAAGAVLVEGVTGHAQIFRP